MGTRTKHLYVSLRLIPRPALWLRVPPFILFEARLVLKALLLKIVGHEYEPGTSCTCVHMVCRGVTCTILNLKQSDGSGY